MIFYGMMEIRLFVFRKSASNPSSASWNLGWSGIRQPYDFPVSYVT